MSNQPERRTIGSFIGKVITGIVGIVVVFFVIIAILINADIKFWAYIIEPTIIVLLVTWIVAIRCHKKK